MVSLVIDLQAGFSNDTVVVEVNRKEVLNRTMMSTDYSIGLAYSTEVQVPQGPVTIAVHVPSRGISDIFSEELSNKTYLGVSIVNSQINFDSSNEMFTYF